MILTNILATIGKTPVVKLNSIGNELDCNMYVKCEFLNAGGSVKDRIGFKMIESAEQSGKIKPGDTLIEPTSGNTGIGLAIVCKEYDLKLKIVIPKTQSIEKKVTLKKLGAELIEVEAVPYSNPKNYIKQRK